MSLSKIFLIPHRMPKSPWPVVLRPKCLHGDVVKALIQAIPKAIKGKRSKCTIYFQWPTESYSLYWSKITGFLLSPKSLEDLHIQEDTMSMPYVNTMKEPRGTPWRIARLSKTRFNPWSTQIRVNSENLSVVIRSIKIKDQLGAIFVCLFDHECFHTLLKYVNIAWCQHMREMKELVFQIFCHHEFCWYF